MRVCLLLAMAATLAIGGTGIAAETNGTTRLVRPADAAADATMAPRVLRGDAVAPRPVPEPPAPGRWRVAGGDRLWLVDPAAGEAVVCRLLDTSTVGVSIVRCHTGDLPRVVTD